MKKIIVNKAGVTISKSSYEKKLKNLMLQAQKEAQRALKSIELLSKHRNPTEEQKESGHNYDDELQRVYIRAFLTHSATCSRILFPSQNKRDRTMALKIRQEFSIDDDSPLKNREVRDACEHIDERIESWAENASFGSPFNENITSGVDLSQVENEVLLHYDDSVQAIWQRTRSGNLAKLDITPLAKELEKIIIFETEKLPD